MTELNKIALRILLNGKGILAADESNGTMTKRLDAVKIPSNFENRLQFREILFTSEAMKNCIGGVILFDETINQTSSTKKTIPEIISNSGAVPGIKVDTGAKPLANSSNETITEGLDGLRDRLKNYYKLGARFTKWRGVYTITKDNPSKLSIHSNAHALARYSALAQECGMVPIVEPEILMDGTHTIDESYQLTTETLYNVFYELVSQGVELEGIVLKPNMVLSGYDCSDQASVEQVAEMTVDCFLNTVPAVVPGVAFLSGGQSDELATAHLNAMNQIDGTPWNLTFSYGRALQAPALKAWSGKDENISNAQESFMKRAKFNSLATKGEYSKDME